MVQRQAPKPTEMQCPFQTEISHGWKTEEMLKRREWRTAEKIHAERKPCPPVQGQPAVKHFFHVFLSSELRFCRNTTDKQNVNVDLDREKIWPK